MKRSYIFSAVLLTVAVAFTALPDFAEADGPFRFFAITPCRIFDSRADFDGTTPLPNGLHDIRVQGVCGVPVGAKAAALNVTVVTPSKNGHVTLFPVGASPEPAVSTLNFLAGESALANGAIVPLGPDNAGADDLNFRYSMAPPATGHIVFDVTGYFATVP